VDLAEHRLGDLAHGLLDLLRDDVLARLPGRLPTLIRSASSKVMPSVFWISSVYWLPPVVLSRVKTGTAPLITFLLMTDAPRSCSATVVSSAGS
jgi:hypothetical protein